MCYFIMKFGTASLNNLQDYTYLYRFLLVWLLWKGGGGGGGDEEKEEKVVVVVVVVVIVE